MASDPILAEIVSAFAESAKRNSFNGIVAASLLRFENDLEHLRSRLAAFVTEHKITCVFARTQLSVHIKRLPDLPIDTQHALLDTENLDEFWRRVWPPGGLYPPGDGHLAEDLTV